ncbi:tetratricopeptide repeat protein [Nonomuraea sp. NPDC049152]|uniref:tetratricopeptide repeat protein n=1 Tax=Nonomuraea sp. NPDC049152 TaxID=3154350 RepID=UPI0034004F97
MKNEELARAAALREEDRHEEARELLVALSAQHPDDGDVARATAYVHDSLGLEHEAVPYYERALELGADDRIGLFTGFGSTLRVIGRYDDALAVLERGLAEFPGDPSLRAFKAMALYNTGQDREAVSTLLKLLAEGGQTGGYARAVAYYADNLDEIVKPG